MIAFLKRNNLYGFIFLLAANSLFAEQTCWQSLNPQEQQTMLDASVAGNEQFADIPKMHYENGFKSVPVYLVNTDTVDKLTNLFKYSYGMIHQMQPNWNMDHGALRFQNVLIDLDEAGARLFGEIHHTGLSWFDVFESTKRLIDKERPEVRLSLIHI